MSELNDLFSVEKQIKIGNREVTIKTIKLGDIPKVVTLAKHFQADNDLKQVAIHLLSNDFPSVIQLFEVTTDLKKSEIEDLNPAAAMLIFNNVMVVNSDFLLTYVVPQVQEMTKSMTDLTGSKPRKS